MDHSQFEDGDEDAPMGAMQSAAMTPAINAIVSGAVIAAAKRAGSADIALGIVDALRRLRSAVDEEAGYSMASGFDGMIRNQILGEKLVAFRMARAEPAAVPLPEPGAKALEVSAILISAAESCLTVNMMAPDNGPLEAAVRAFVAHLHQKLGGTAAWGPLLRALRRPLILAGDLDVTVYPDPRSVN